MSRHLEFSPCQQFVLRHATTLCRAIHLEDFMSRQLPHEMQTPSKHIHIYKWPFSIHFISESHCKTRCMQSRAVGCNNWHRCTCVWFKSGIALTYDSKTMVAKRHTASHNCKNTCTVAFVHCDDHYIQPQSQVKPSHTIYIVFFDIRFLIAWSWLHADGFFITSSTTSCGTAFADTLKGNSTSSQTSSGLIMLSGFKSSFSILVL